VIRFSAFLVAVAVGLLVAGVVTSKLLLVYLAIGASGVALLTLAAGVALKRQELFGDAETADAAVAPPVSVPAQAAVSPAQAPAVATVPPSPSLAGYLPPEHSADQPGSLPADQPPHRPADQPSTPEPPAAPAAEAPAVPAPEAPAARAVEAPAVEPSAPAAEGSATTAEAPAPSGPEAAPASAEPDSDLEVTVVPGVPRFHNARCILIRFMGEGDLEKMTLAAAKEAGCTPCRACLPDQPEKAPK
jgi:cytoskeletal protein RodZ